MSSTATDFSNIVGVFRESADAARAVDALKQAGFREDQIHLTEYQPHVSASEEENSPERDYLLASLRRTLVQVHAEGREQEAVGILVNNGMNNSDIPPGTTLIHGSIVSTNSETVDLLPDESGASAAGGLFDKGVEAKSGLADDPNIKRA